ncbi:MAG: hypothetical protein RR348_02590 [Clostridia bacterium]
MLNKEQFDYNCVLRYLNISQNNLKDYKCAIDNAIAEVTSLLVPKTAYRLFEMSVVDNKCHIENGCVNGNFDIVSKDMASCFKGCEHVLIMAVTIGGDIDKKLKYYYSVDLDKAKIVDAVASVCVENLLDELEAQLRHVFAPKHFSMRFSAGYGDAQLCLQKPILQSIDGFERLGITLNDKFFMTPTKSITALIGLGDCVEGVVDPCAVCKFKGKCVIKCNASQKHNINCTKN